jgi:hypothetical protein
VRNNIISESHNPASPVMRAYQTDEIEVPRIVQVYAERFCLNISLLTVVIKN